jgi:hypothetical protein
MVNPDSSAQLSSQQEGLSQKVLDNLQEIELDLDTSGEYFKPQTGTTYEVEIDIDKHRILPIESDKFKDSKGRPLKQYQFVVRHVGNDVEQKWNVTSKTLLRQLMGEIRKRHTSFRITRNGEDRSTTYTIEAAQVQSQTQAQVKV